MLRTEYGGMNEVLANLYGLTGKEQYLHAAHLFEQPIFLDPLAQHRDESPRSAREHACAQGDWRRAHVRANRRDPLSRHRASTFSTKC